MTVCLCCNVSSACTVAQISVLGSWFWTFEHWSWSRKIESRIQACF